MLPLNVRANAASLMADTTTRISLLVASPGTEIYELEGHAAMRIVHGQRDYAINWGLFNFDQPHFVYRFVKGETDYGIGAIRTPDFIGYYAATGRGVIEIPINLSSEETRRVVALIDSTLQPGCNVYRYNYVKDNCSTRPITIIEQALGDTLRLTNAADFGGLPLLTFRDVMRYYHRYHPWYQFGIDLALGSGIDYPITPHEMTFAPVLLPRLLDQAHIGDRIITGQPHEIIIPGRWNVKPTPWYLTPMAVACGILLATIAICWHDIRRRRVTHWFHSAIFSLYGIMGCVVAFLILISSHEATSPNWLLLWLNPLGLLPAVCIWIKSAKKVVLCYHFVNFVALIILAIVWPMIGQSGNSAFVPMIVSDALCSVSYIYINKCLNTTAKRHHA